MVTSVTTETQIINSALNKMGAERILSIDDNSDRARLMKNQYYIKRDELLRMHPWRFSTAYVQLAAITKPAAVFDFDYAYQLPSNCARVFKTSLPSSAKWSEIEGGLLVTDYLDSDGLRVKYGKIITDVTKYDASFVELLAWFLAADTVYAITQSRQAASDAQATFDRMLTTARSYSAQVGSGDVVVADDWVNARY
jgi:hypothetical protein